MVTHKPKAEPATMRRARRADDAPRLRPLARVQRIALFEREVRERVSPAALDLVFSRAEVISEGQRTTRRGREVYLGSTMLTIDLEGIAPALREPCDAGTARRLAALLAADAGAAARIEAIAASEAARVAGTRPREVTAERTIEARGVRVFIDVDVEAAL